MADWRPSALALILAIQAAAPLTAESSALPRLGPAPNFALTTQQDDRLWLTQLRDRLVVLTFVCTACDACAGLLPRLGELSRSLGDAAGRRVFFVAVSVDAGPDPTALRRFARSRGLEPPAWLFLTGRPTEVEVVTRRYGVAVHRAGGRLTHDCLVSLIDGAGAIRVRYGALELGQLRADLATLLAESGAP